MYLFIIVNAHNFTAIGIYFYFGLAKDYRKDDQGGTAMMPETHKNEMIYN